MHHFDAVIYATGIITIAAVTAWSILTLAALLFGGR